MEYLTLTVHEFRKNMKAALDTALEGNIVIIDRMGQRFSLTHIPRGIELATASPPRIESGKPECYCNDFPITPHSHITTDKVSSNIRPDIKNISVATPQIEEIEAMPHHKDDGVPNPFVTNELSCCTRKTPCKHWSFEDGVWVNSISNRVREVTE